MHSLNAASISRQWESSPIYSMPNPNILSSSTTIISGVPVKDTTRIYSMPTFAKNLPSEVIFRTPYWHTPTTNCCGWLCKTDWKPTDYIGLWWKSSINSHNIFWNRKLLPSSRTFMMWATNWWKVYYTITDSFIWMRKWTSILKQ